MIKIILFLLLIIFIIILIFLKVNKNNKIEKIYVINLKRRKERLEIFKKNYNLSQKLNIIEAIDGNDLDLKQLQNEKIINNITINQLNKERNYHYELTHKGSLGCYLSHYKIWKITLENNDNIILIYEDDSIFTSITLEEINNRIKKLPEDWDIYLLINPDFCYAKININNEIYKVKRFFLTNAYIINKKAIEKIFNSNTLFPIVQQLDSYLSELAIDFNLNIYIHNKNYKFYNQNNNYKSDIQEESLLILSYDRYKYKNI